MKLISIRKKIMKKLLGLFALALLVNVGIGYDEEEWCIYDTTEPEWDCTFEPATVNQFCYSDCQTARSTSINTAVSNAETAYTNLENTLTNALKSCKDDFDANVYQCTILGGTLQECLDDYTPSYAQCMGEAAREFVEAKNAVCAALISNISTINTDFVACAQQCCELGTGEGLEFNSSIRSELLIVNYRNNVKDYLNLSIL